MDENKPFIRYMTLNDLDVITEIASGCFLAPWGRADFEFSVKSGHDTGLVAELGGRVVGFCIIRCSSPQADVIDVAVIPEARKQGIATIMVEHLLEEGRKRGVSDFMLEVRKSNAPAIRLYENVGFKTIGIRKKYYSTPVEDALVMQCIFQ